MLVLVLKVLRRTPLKIYNEMRFVHIYNNMLHRYKNVTMLSYHFYAFFMRLDVISQIYWMHIQRNFIIVASIDDYMYHLDVICVVFFVDKLLLLWFLKDIIQRTSKNFKDQNQHSHPNRNQWNWKWTLLMRFFWFRAI